MYILTHSQTLWIFSHSLSSPTANSVTAGQLLCSGLFSPDPVSNWFAAVALSHALVDNPGQKVRKKLQEGNTYYT